MSSTATLGSGLLLTRDVQTSHVKSNMGCGNFCYVQMSDCIKGRYARFHSAPPATYSVAFEEHVQVLCGLAVLVVIEGALVDGVLAIRLRTVAAIEAFLPQSL